MLEVLLNIITIGYTGWMSICLVIDFLYNFISTIFNNLFL